MTETYFKRYYKTLEVELSSLTDELVDYRSLLAAINRSKTNSLGRMRPCPPYSTRTTPKIDRLNKELGAALEKHRRYPSEANLLKAQVLERTLRKATDAYETTALHDLIFRLEGLYHVQKMRLFYKKVKERTSPKSNPTFVIRNPNSLDTRAIYSTTKEEYLNFWTMYLEKTFACEYPIISYPMKGVPRSPSLLHLNKCCPQSDMNKPLTKAEVCSAIETLKNLKAAGLDEVTNEDIKLIENLRPGLIHIVLLKIWEDEKCPKEFCMSIFHLIPKLGKPGKPKDLRLQKNYRPIALLSAIRKLYEIILSSRILKHVSLNQAQFGFLSGRSTSDCIFLLVEAILEARYVVRGPRNGRNQRLFAAFLDFKGAFDGVPRHLMWQKMSERFGICGKLLRVIIDLYTGTTGQAIVNELYTQRFLISSGVLQGSVLGPTLFLLFLDDLLEELHESMLGISMGDFILSVLAYADDVTLLSLDTKNLQQLLDICNTWAIANGMIFGLDKCFAVVFNSRTKRPEALPTFYLGGTETCPNLLPTFYPEKAPELYLGMNITDQVARTKLDITNKLPCSLVPNYRRKPNPAYLKLIKSKFLRARHGTCQLCPNKNILTPSISTRLYKTLQRSTLLYAIELGDWDIDQIRELEILQAKALRSCLNSDLHCPQALVRLFCGVEPIEARRDLHSLLYYAKLCSYDPASFPSMVHLARISNSDLPVGFHSTALRIFQKYKLEHFWNNIPDVPHDKLIAIFKKPIWLQHWLKDVASASCCDSPFSTTFLKDVCQPTFPYKTDLFMKNFPTHDLPRSELSTILRFWMTPSRERNCSCGVTTTNIAKHLIFECPRTRELMTCYKKKLSTDLLAILHPNMFSQFLAQIESSAENFNSLNKVIGKFDYPKF